MIKRTRPPGHILSLFYGPAKYAAMVLISICLPLFPPVVSLLPVLQGSRAFLMVWPFLLIFVSLKTDRIVRQAHLADLQEASAGMRGAGCQAAGFLALFVPLLLVLDTVAIAHAYFCYFSADAGSSSPSLPLTVLMAAGCVLLIYGTQADNIPYRSIWGLRTAASMASPEGWKALHQKAALLFFRCGLCLLFAGSLLLLL